MNYQQKSLAGLNGVELIVALYDGMVRFLYRAVEAVEAGDVSARRRSVKRVLDILIHLQGRLRMDIGGRPAAALSDFYTAMFALTLQGSQHGSTERLMEAIGCIRTVREAWQQVALDPEVRKTMPRDWQAVEERFASLIALPGGSRLNQSPPMDGALPDSCRWMA